MDGVKAHDCIGCRVRRYIFLAIHPRDVANAVYDRCTTDAAKKGDGTKDGDNKAILESLESQLLAIIDRCIVRNLKVPDRVSDLAEWAEWQNHEWSRNGEPEPLAAWMTEPTNEEGGSE